MNLKNILYLLTPPIITRLVKTLRVDPKSPVEWEYVPGGWAFAETHPEIKGWNVQDILEVYKEKWPRFEEMLEGTGPLGVTHESALTENENIYGHNSTMAFAYVLALAARHKDKLAMLDWGGGIGHFLLLAEALVPCVDFEYHCKDVPLFAEHGSKLFPQQNFYQDSSCFARTYDLVIASTSLHYEEDWRSLFSHFARVTSDYLYIANLPIVKRVPSFVFVQRPYNYGYNTEYLGWCLNRDEFLTVARQAGLNLLREFVYGHQPVIQRAPEQNVYRGFLFQKNRDGVE